MALGGEKIHTNEDSKPVSCPVCKSKKHCLIHPSPKKKRSNLRQRELFDNMVKNVDSRKRRKYGV
jgi:hypothetical protein